MWKRLSVVLALALALSACSKDRSDENKTPPINQLDEANFPQESGTGVGRWESQPAYDNGMTASKLLYVNRQNQVAMGAKCSEAGMTAEKIGMAKTRIDGNTLELLESFNMTLMKPDGGVFCTLNVNAGKYFWYYHNETLVFADENGGNGSVFYRRN